MGQPIEDPNLWFDARRIGNCILATLTKRDVVSPSRQKAEAALRVEYCSYARWSMT